MMVATRRFGPIEQVDVPEQHLYEFYPGLGGFEGHHNYALITDADSPVEWLQSTSDPSVVFALLEPFLFYQDYGFELPDADASALGLNRPEQAMVRCILTLRESADAISANLMAPVVLNPQARLGRQILLHDSGLPLRFPVLDTLASEDEAPVHAPATPAAEVAA